MSVCVADADVGCVIGGKIGICECVAVVAAAVVDADAVVAKASKPICP